MKNKFKLLCLLSLLSIPNVAFATKYIVCGNDRHIPYAFADIFSIIIVIIRIIVPILIVIMGMVSYLKIVMSGKAEEDMKKGLKQLINSVLAAIVIFFIVSIINFAIGLTAGKDNSASACISCLVSPEKCKSIEDNEVICPGLMGQEYDADCNVISDPHHGLDDTDINKDNYINADNSSSTSSNDNSNASASNYSTPATVSPTDVLPDNSKAMSCCLTANGNYKDGSCKPYQINSSQNNAYNACVNAGQDTKTCCETYTDGKFVNNKCSVEKFNQDAYNSCMKQGVFMCDFSKYILLFFKYVIPIFIILIGITKLIFNGNRKRSIKKFFVCLISGLFIFGLTFLIEFVLKNEFTCVKCAIDTCKVDEPVINDPIEPEKENNVEKPVEPVVEKNKIEVIDGVTYVDGYMIIKDVMIVLLVRLRLLLML